MTCRMESSSWFTQTYNAENRLSVVQKLASGNCTSPGMFAAQWNFSYDGDGTRVAQSYIAYDLNGNPGTPVLTEYFMGGLYEMSGSQVKKYYSMAGMTIAMNDGTGLKYLLTDQLGSVVAMTDSTGTLISQQRYLPFGQVRTDVSSPNSPATDLAFTGQRNLDAQGNVSLGLMDYNARMYDPYLNQWTQPDSIIPQPYNPQSFDRYAYVLNNPINLIDPSGHTDSWWCTNSPCNAEYAPDANGVIGGHAKKKGDNSSSSSQSGSGVYFSVISKSSSSSFDLLSEFWNITGLTPKSMCATLLGPASNPLCDPRTYDRNNYNIDISSPGISMPTSGQITTGLNLVSQGVGITDALKWTKWPLVSALADAGAQWSEDNGKGYTGMQKVIRAGVRVGEGQLASSAGLVAAGTALLPGAAIRDVIIATGGYVIASSSTNFWLDVANNTVTRYSPIPSLSNLFPQTLLPIDINGQVQWCYGTLVGC